jgi:2-methylisocitrate lyase-like PEP mutase family enzyme
MHSVDALEEKARRFAELHKQTEILVLPNAWDVASARIFEEAGFPAIGTSSAGIAFALGSPDGEVLPWAEHLDALRRIVRAVRVPVTADIESGYSEFTEQLANVITDVMEAGIVGINLEDGNPRAGDDGRDALFSLAEQISRIRTIRRTVSRGAFRLFLNARTDAYWLGLGHPSERIHLAIERAAAFVEAGADGVFVPGLNDPAAIAQLTNAVKAPVNILGGQGVPSVPELQRLGVKRVSVGSGPMRAAMGHTRRVAEELKNRGTYRLITDGSVSYADANRLFKHSE